MECETCATGRQSYSGRKDCQTDSANVIREDGNIYIMNTVCNCGSTLALPPQYCNPSTGAVSNAQISGKQNKQCTNVNGKTANVNDCTCGTNLCHSQIGLYCLSSKNACANSTISATEIIPLATCSKSKGSAVNGEVCQWPLWPRSIAFCTKKQVWIE